MRLQGKRAVVTGAGSGIGAAIARAFHAEGASVLLADVSGVQISVAQDLGDRAVAHHVDVADEDAVHAMIAAAVAEFGGLDVLSNNAGIDGPPAPIQDCKAADFERVMSVNLRGTFFAMHYAIPVMVEQGGGSIINMSSIAGMVATPMMAPYCASKGALIQLTKVGAVEGGPNGVRVNAICPGAIDTPMVREMAKAAPELIGAVEAMTPLRRLGQPEEVASLAVLLAGDEAKFLTGAAIAIDGAFTSL